MNRDHRLIIGSLLFVFGIYLFYQLTQLPPISAFFLLGLYFLVHYNLFWRALLAVLSGFYWAWLWTLCFQPNPIPSHWIKKDIQAWGEIIRLPKNSDFKNHFIFKADRLSDQTKEIKGSWQFELNWYQPDQPVFSGQYWHFKIRLKPVIGFRNPGSFDKSAYAYQKGILYQGYVRGQARLIAQKWRLDRWRQSLSERIDQLPIERQARAVIKALVIGDRSDMRYRDKQLFQSTGTMHLMAISGLHIGFIAGIGFLIGQAWRYIPPWVARYPASLAATLLAFLFAAFYAALAGFSLPTQRALWMLGIFSIAWLSCRHIRPARSWALALLAVSLYHPIGVLNAGFWLSFAAVALILFFVPKNGFKSGLIRTQLIISLGLVPILFWQHMPVALLSPLVNLIYIPLFGLLIVPLTLLATLLDQWFPNIGEILLQWDAQLIHWAYQGLQNIPPWVWTADHPGAFALAVLSICLVILLSFKLHLKQALILGTMGIILIWIPILIPTKPWPKGHFQLSVLDVGQALSVVVQTQNHVLLYDTGFGYRFNAGQAVILPFFRTRHIDSLDMMIISHSDKDHAGGAEFIVRHFAVKTILSGEPDRIRVPAQSCQAGQSWQWDGVQFEIIHPPAESHYRDNAASCVLRISNAQYHVLLTGDIGKKQEKDLIQNQPQKIKADIIVAPHHGSRYSSSPAFVDAVQADWVIYSAGPYNRWGFPRPETMQRWQPAQQFSTAQSGMIEFSIGKKITGPTLYAQAHRHFWQPN